MSTPISRGAVKHLVGASLLVGAGVVTMVAMLNVEPQPAITSTGPAPVVQRQADTVFPSTDSIGLASLGSVTTQEVAAPVAVVAPVQAPQSSTPGTAAPSQSPEDVLATSSIPVEWHAFMRAAFLDGNGWRTPAVTRPVDSICGSYDNLTTKLRCAYVHTLQWHGNPVQAMQAHVDGRP